MVKNKICIMFRGCMNSFPCRKMISECSAVSLVVAWSRCVALVSVITG